MMKKGAKPAKAAKKAAAEDDGSSAPAGPLSAEERKDLLMKCFIAFNITVMIFGLLCCSLQEDRLDGRFGDAGYARPRWCLGQSPRGRPIRCSRRSRGDERGKRGPGQKEGWLSLRFPFVPSATGLVRMSLSPANG